MKIKVKYAILVCFLVIVTACTKETPEAPILIDANEHNNYMISSGSLSHDNFSARAAKISSKESAEYVAENVAKDYETAEEAFQGWLKSTNHRSTMEGEFTHTAVSVKKTNTGKFYYTR